MQNAVNARSYTSTILVSYNQTGLILNLGLSQLSLFLHIGHVETQVWEYECVDFCVVTLYFTFFLAFIFINFFVFVDIIFSTF